MNARPAAIAWFERLYIGSLAIAVAVMAAGWDSVGEVPTLVMLAGIVLGVLLPVGLVLLVSRMRSRIAQWVLIALFAIGLASNATIYDPGVNWGVDMVVLVTTAMQMLAVALLFTRSARAWMARKDEAAPGPISG